MAELQFESLLQGGIAVCLRSPEARRQAAEQIPDLVASRLAEPVEPEARAGWLARFAEEYWPALHRERGGQWDLGWAEVVAGFAVAIELLAEELSASVRGHLEGTPAQSLWERSRRPYERYALLIDSDDVHIRRIFIAPDSRRFRVDGPHCQDKSHALLHALITRSVLPRDIGSVAATGELDSDERRVLPVFGLVSKVRAWRERSPEGALVTGPLGDLGVEGWQELVWPRTYSQAARDSSARWIAGGSITELRAKLKTPAPVVTSWDGTVLSEGSIAELGLTFASERPRNPPLNNDLLDAAWAAFRAEKGRRGVVIQGAPGSGKSILSRVMERRFRAGPLGALGFGVRRSARELAQDLRRAPAPTWLDVLCVREPQQRELFEELERTGRLVPIVDGLDELGSAQLREVAALLRTSRGWWVATSRPVTGIVASLPPAWSLKIGDLSREDGRKLLSGAGRADLAELVFPENWHEPLRRAEFPASLAPLTTTPLHLSLLLRIAPKGTRLDRMAAHEIYHRVFQGLLDQACQAQRLSEREVHLLRQLQANLLGALALTWLQAGSLDGPTLDLALEDAGFTIAERPDIVRALEFGHLLAPAGDAWDFAHRTLAEWAAAGALHREVTHRLREHARSTGRLADRAERVRIELEVLAPFVEPRILAGNGPWAQLLLFYAPYLVEPLALLDRWVGPEARPGWLLPDERRLLHEPESPSSSRTASTDEVLASWDFVFDVLTHASWERAEDARIAWAIAARRWLLFAFGDRSPNASYGDKRAFPALRAFARVVAHHLPKHLSELVALIAKTGAQLERLRGDPMLLLPAIPPTHASAIEHVLKGGLRKDQLTALEWHAEHGLNVDTGVLDGLLQTLPVEIGEATAAGQDRWTEHSLLCRLEEMVWETSVCVRRPLPWALVRSRLLEWPSHLAKVILRWLSEGAEEQSAPESEREDLHRRDVVATIAHEAGTATARLLDDLRHLQAAPGGPEIVEEVKRSFHDNEDWHLERLLSSFAAKLGWTLRDRWTLEPARSAEAQELRHSIWRLHGLRERLAEIVRALPAPRLERVVGELWELLPPDHPDRQELLLAIEATRRPPPQVPTSVLLAKDAWWTDDIAWTDKHLVELRVLAGSAEPGQEALRFTAIRLLARRESRDETTALLQVLPAANERLAELIREHLERRTADAASTELLPPAALQRLPLPLRAERDVPGWKEELLTRLAESSDDSRSLAELAARHRVREALPLLAEQLGERQWTDHPLIEAIAGLCTEADERWARIALHHALRHGWPDAQTAWSQAPLNNKKPSPAGEQLARFLRLEDLDVLAQGTVSALRAPSLTKAIRRLGPEAQRRLLDHYREVSAQVLRLDPKADTPQEDFPLSEPYSEPLTKARQRRDALAETLVASFDPARATVAEAVELAFQVVGGDVHHVYSVPGPLGSEFDEPGDLDWHSTQENAALIEALGRHLETCLSHEPQAWPALRRLFVHPSETLRKRAFELCSDRALPHQVAELALEALKGHARANRTRWAGNTAGLLLSNVERGAGSNNVSLPNVEGELVKAVRSRLTPAHRPILETLARHEHPAFRSLAARWAGEIGSSEWVELLQPLLGDSHPGVVRSAVNAILVLAAGRLDEALCHADRSAWTSLHDIAVLHRLKAPALRPFLFVRDNDNPVEPLKHVSATTLELLIAQAAERCSQRSEGERPSETPFDGFPTLVEELCAALWHEQKPGRESMEMLRGWSRHEDARIRAAARRLRAMHGDLTTEEVLPLLPGEPSDRICAAECLVRLADEGHRPDASAVWEAALGNGEQRRSFGKFTVDEGELQDRLLWALEGATPAFARLLSLVARTIPYDDREGCDTPRGDYLARRVAEIASHWGGPGAVALIEMMEASELEDHYLITDEVKALARGVKGVRALLESRAAAHDGPSRWILKELRDEEERRDLAGLAARLAAEVFPEDWPGLTLDSTC